jgi:hypothetical protein
MSTFLRTKIIVAALGMAVLSGCATGPNVSVSSYNDLNNFRVDCRYKEEQLAFLRTQIAALKAGMYQDGGYMASGVGRYAAGIDGSYAERYLRARGYHRTVVYEKMNYLELNCP